MSMFATDFAPVGADDGMNVSNHSGALSTANQANPAGGVSPTHSLVVLWFVVLASYWALGYALKGQAS